MILILEKFNLDFFRLINNLAGRWNWLDSFFIFFADYLGFLLVVFVLLWGWRERRGDFKRIFIITLGSAIIARLFIVEAIRYFIYYPRPFAVLENINQLIVHAPTSSFPSGHATFFFALAFGTYFYSPFGQKKIGVWLLVLAGLIGFSRIYAGIHWPLDIIAGIIVGWVTVCLVNKSVKKWESYSGREL